MRRRPALALTTALTATLALAGLTACAAPAATPDPSSAADCVATAPGTASDSVSVTGDLGAVVTIDAPYPLAVATTERTVLVAGSGDPLVDGKRGMVHYALVNGATGEPILDTHDASAEPEPWDFLAGAYLPGVEAVMHCAQAGSRVVGVIPAEEGWGAEGIADIGLEPGQPLVLVVDVLSITDTPDDATGTTPEGPIDLPAPQAWTNDIPAVDLSGALPTVTIPDLPAPTELVLTVLEAGDGTIVPNPSTVTVDYLGTAWESGEIFDSSYDRGAPATFPLGGVIPGFAAAIAGQQVGSTVLVSIPPALAYGETGSHELAGQTLVFLIHIVSYE